MRVFLSAWIAAGSAVASLHFLRFRRQGGAKLLSLFGAAFAVMACNHVALAFVTPGHEARVWLYGLRLAAFALILFAIVGENRRS